MHTLQRRQSVLVAKKSLKVDLNTWESVQRHVEAKQRCLYLGRTSTEEIIVGMARATVIANIIQRISNARIQFNTMGSIYMHLKVNCIVALPISMFTIVVGTIL